MDGTANNRDLNGDTGNPSGDAGHYASSSAILGFADGDDSTDDNATTRTNADLAKSDTESKRDESIRNTESQRANGGNRKLTQRERNRINNRRYRERKRAEQRGKQPNRDRGNSDGDRAGSSENDNTISFSDFEQAARDLGSETVEENESAPKGVDFASLLGDDNQSFKKVLRDPKLINIGGAAIDAVFSGLVALGAGEHWRLAGNECEALAKSWIAVLETTVVGKKKKNLEKWVAKRLPLGTALLVTIGIFYPRFNAEWEAYKRAREANNDTTANNTDSIRDNGQQTQSNSNWGEKNGFRRFGG